MAIIKRPARSNVSDSVRPNISNYSQWGEFGAERCMHCVSNFSKVLHKAQQSNLLRFLNTESN